jgi:hypothetical protein
MVLTQKLTVQMTNKIYLDDVRTPVANDWVVVRNFEQFVKAGEKISLDNIETISLDHDLGDSAMWEYHNNVSRNYSLDYNNIKEKTGYDCAKWLVNRFYEENPDWANKDRSVKRAKKMPFPTVYTHSANPIGSANIMGYINNFLMNEAKEQTCVRVRIDHTA